MIFLAHYLALVMTQNFLPKWSQNFVLINVSQEGYLLYSMHVGHREDRWLLLDITG